MKDPLGIRKALKVTKKEKNLLYFLAGAFDKIFPKKCKKCNQPINK